jgi:hypothetical protein
MIAPISGVTNPQKGGCRAQWDSSAHIAGAQAVAAVQTARRLDVHPRLGLEFVLPATAFDPAESVPGECRTLPMQRRTVGQRPPAVSFCSAATRTGPGAPRCNAAHHREIRRQREDRHIAEEGMSDNVPVIA